MEPRIFHALPLKTPLPNPPDRKGESADELLGDKRHISEQRDRYRAYETVVDEVELQAGDAAGASARHGAGDEYDDEYDDTYDVNQVGANDLDGDTLLSRRYGRGAGPAPPAYCSFRICSFACVAMGIENRF